ncbi:MAG TPA: hypothetical protein VFT95_12030, partial [Micromonosporaceae bacterium]|nr:hypothetical protein [Micromonosporaceae bacterium]
KQVSAKYWELYRAAARSCGLDYAIHDPSSIVVDAIGGTQAAVFVAGEQVNPADTLFVTDLYTLPQHIPDTFKQISAFTVLEQLGFYLPVPPQLSLIANDKLATALYLADCPVAPIPTFRFGTGRDESIIGAASLAALPYPVVVKPAGWGAGLGILLAEDESQVRAIASLAGGADCDLVCQPFLGAGTEDYRLYFVEGQVHTTMRRVPSPGEVVANVMRGGRAEYVDLPAGLTEAAEYLGEKLAIPFFCADFLFDGQEFHLSEIELDGLYGLDQAGRNTGLLEARFAAYVRQHERFLGRAPSQVAAMS